MRLAPASVLVFLLTVSPAFAAAPQSLESMSWLIGKTWTAQVSGGPLDVTHIDTRYEWAATENFVQFTTRFVGRDGTVKRSYAGMFYFDPMGGPTLWYMDSDGLITTGPVTVKPDGMQMTFNQKGTDYRIDIIKQDARSYQWTLFERKSGRMQKDFALTFVQSG